MPCAAAPNAAETAVAKSAMAMQLPDADPSAAAPYPSLAPSTNATPASTTFVATVVGSVIPPNRGSDASPSLIVEVGVVKNGSEELDVVSVPLTLESLVGVIASLEP